MTHSPTIKFHRSDPNDWFEASLDELGIDQTIIEFYGSLQAVLDDVVLQPEFVDNGFIFYKIIWQT